jgi:SpoVK/Ycf46/Vps4 family AAA+-type ATPase
MVEPVKLRELTAVQFRERSFKKLVIRQEYKSTVQALVSTYTADQKEFRDLVEGKGRGLVILLHGPPGTGKTLTAGKNSK